MTGERSRRRVRAGRRGSFPPGVLVFVLFLVPVGCGDDAAGPPRIGDPAPSYESRTLGGEPLAVGVVEDAPVLLNFWATWCTPCRTETPFLQEIHERYGPRGLRVVGVSMDSPGSEPEIRAFVKEMGVSYRVVHDARQRGMDVFHLLGLPATFVLDRQGTIRFARIGPVSEGDADFRAVLERVVSQELVSSGGG